MRKLVSNKSSSVFVLFRMLWMIMFLLHLRFCFSITATCIQKEREALLQFKNSFYYDPSLRLASWNGTDCCNWNGVGCNQTTGHVTMIDLRCDLNQVDFNLYALYSNSIDSSLLELKYLNHLDLSGNDFNYTQIPSFLSSMVELTYLNLSGAYFLGKFLPPLGNLTKLNVLDLSYNWYESHGDVEWIFHLSSLQFLSLNDFDFSKTSNLMQVLTSFPMLSSLRLTRCRLQNIHFSFSSLNYSLFLSRVQLLDLSYNELSHPTLKFFQNMTSLKYLDLSGNHYTAIFYGGISTFISNNCGLKTLALWGNFDLGDVFGSSYENESMGCNNKGFDLEVLDLKYTSLATKVPDWLAKFKNLKTIDLRHSMIYGPIPTSLGNLSNLKYLDLSFNNLTRLIPTSFEKLLNLEELDISSNPLTGVLTEASFANLSRLQSLKLGYNNELLSLDVNSNWIPPFQLKLFYATSCIHCVGSEFPQWLQTQKTLVDLRLSNNQIMGPLPANIADQMPKLKILILNDNLINGSLPLSLCKLNLNILDLSNNRLFGMVQGCLLTPNLTFFDLSWNKFSGTFPSRGNFSYIRKVYLKNNNFEGPMPIVLKNSNLLEVLDLTGNRFSGSLPTWVGNNLKSLRILKLRSNLFNGTIPSSLCNLTKMQNLDLAHNQLEGSIPPNLSNFQPMTRNDEYEITVVCEYDRSCFADDTNMEQSIKSSNFNYSFAQITSMVNIDLSNNSLVGIIPSEITSLKKLIGLNLSHNNLTGIIPAEIGEIESLESLDLSFNQLSGPIPQSLSKINSLGVLILSHNNLSGNIPREGHLSTFNEVSNFDNNSYLCGDPLPIKCAIENPSESPFESIDNEDEDEEKWEKWLFYIMIITGFIVGFWGVVGGLILKKSWRYSYFKFMDETNYKINAAIWRCVECLKRNLHVFANYQ